jgi:hypothetical protein
MKGLAAARGLSFCLNTRKLRRRKLRLRFRKRESLKLKKNLRNAHLSQDFIVKVLRILQTEEDQP